MKIKLDENLGARGVDLFRGAGHDVATVADQGLCSATDGQVAATCQGEPRCLVSLDLDFGNPLLFPPGEYSGIAILLLPAKSTEKDLWDSCRTLLAGLERENIEGKLWIVSRGRIREYQPEDASGTTA